MSTFTLIGIQRSGTNYVSTLLRERFGLDVTTNSRVWKHAFVSECAGEMEGRRFLAVTRHPVMWLQSCLLHTPRDLVTRRPEFFKGKVNDPASFADVYSHYYSGWSALCSAGQGLLVSYEETLEGSDRYLARLLGTEAVGEAEHVAGVPMSIAFAPEDIEAYRRLECSLDRHVVLEFWSRLDAALPAELGYDLEKVSFVASKSARSIGYHFLQDPAKVDVAEYQQLLREADGRFANDAHILDALSVEQARRGDTNSAMLLGSRAVVAYQDAIDRFAMESGAHAPQVVAIDRLIKALEERRARSIQSTIDCFNARLAEDGLTAARASEACFYLSDAYYRRGDLAKAIEFGYRAIEPVGDTGTRIVIPWLHHHLGCLLAEAGRHEEAVARFAKAFELEPHEFRYPLHATKSCMALGWLDDAARWATLAVSSDPENPAHHYLLGEIELRRGNVDAAISAARVATDLKPPVAWYFHFLGRLYAMKGDYEAASASFAEAIAIDPGDPEHRRGLEDMASAAARCS
ncbi:MAG TPA: tetratricopeptide repeat protein [Bosea sp. (in: a-proteobacteria)]|jgi:tetratricopeptide (TPR) repeat protein|uniref:tetratricopeptide repeat protein n=1 Tax=Bosea sp. (in: a-proteobacteria) TaxID=1871050 RepID=UPI002E144115|nr:tetratricopeptide repeat protein [Bosea sp. (in: a-proteobacteria)]